MRTIKFRGKDIAKGEWVYGFYTQGGYIREDGTTKVRHIIHSDILYDVEEHTIGQFTGLMDKNGIEIYEGDIVKAEEIGGYCLKDVGVVRYFEDGCYFGIETPNYSTKLRFTNEEIKINDGYCTIRFTMEYEVIGNIHDNPELLKGE